MMFNFRNTFRETIDSLKSPFKKVYQAPPKPTKLRNTIVEPKINITQKT